MPHLITNPNAKRNPLLYRKQTTGNSTSARKREEGPEQTTAAPKTYDAMKSPAGADTKAKRKK